MVVVPLWIPVVFVVAITQHVYALSITVLTSMRWSICCSSTHLIRFVLYFNRYIVDQLFGSFIENMCQYYVPLFLRLRKTLPTNELYRRILRTKDFFFLMPSSFAYVLLLFVLNRLFGRAIK
jgi:hypothetical protein